MESAGVDRRRRSRVAGVAAIVDRAATGGILMAPDDGAVLRIERNDPAVPGRDEQQILDAPGRGHIFEEDRGAVDGSGQRHLVLDGERADVGRGQEGLGGVSAAMLGIATELQPVISRCAACAEQEQRRHSEQTSLPRPLLPGSHAALSFRLRGSGPSCQRRPGLRRHGASYDDSIAEKNSPVGPVIPTGNATTRGASSSAGGYAARACRTRPRRCA